MKKTMKNIVSMLLCVAMLSAMSLSALAVDVSASIGSHEGTEQAISSDMLRQDHQEVYIADDLQFFTDGIEESVVNSDVMAMATNRPPVAELQVVVLNPESMIGGKFTTQTQIAWLWSYNGQDFTYDPDGDAIADIRIGGISNNNIIGTLTGNIGFATQFSTAAQYQLTFQVQDSQGAWSNIAKYGFSIEPADGNTRPVCRIGYSQDNLVPNQLMLISWANSTDSDPGDSLDSIGSMIIKNGVTTTLNDYLVQNNGDSCIISFPNTGSYEMWLRVGDSHNAWSDWVIFTVEVETAVISGVSVGGIYEPSSTSAYWVDNRSIRAVTTGPYDAAGVKVLCDEFGSRNFPSVLPSKLVMDSNFDVSGRVLTASGTPVANTSVSIRMPLTSGRGINKTVLTDADGYFSYDPTSSQFWVDTGYYSSASSIYYLLVGDVTGVNTPYIRFSTSTGTNFLYGTSVNISVGGRTYSENVTAEVGYSQNPILGHQMYVNGQWVTYQ